MTDTPCDFTDNGADEHPGSWCYAHSSFTCQGAIAPPSVQRPDDLDAKANLWHRGNRDLDGAMARLQATMVEFDKIAAAHAGEESEYPTEPTHIPAWYARDVGQAIRYVLAWITAPTPGAHP